MSGLSPDTLYFYRFHAVNTVPNPDLEAWSEEGRSFVTSLAGLSINDLNAYSNSPYEVELAWSDSFNTEASFAIQRSPAGANSWVTVGTAPADSGIFTDKLSGLVPGASYDYRVIAANAAGNSDPSNIANVTMFESEPLETRLLVHFNGQLNDTIYTLGEDEIDTTGTFQAHGFPNVNGGIATLNPGNTNGPDGFDINPSVLGNLTTQNWVAEALVTYNSTGTGFAPVVLDVQGDCNIRLRDEISEDVMLMAYWNGSSVQKQLTTLPPAGVKVHIAYSWNASNATLTGYVNGVSFGSISGGAFATPDPSTVSFGYFGRSGYEGRGIDGVLDAVAFQSGTGTFDPASGFLILPQGVTYASWISGFPVGALSGFNDDADGDGLKNGVEAFLGSNPSVANGGAVSQVSSNGTVTTFTHPQAGIVPSDVTGSYEWSLDLGTWYPGDGAAGPAGGPTVNIPRVAPVGGIATVTATSSAPVGKLIIRIKAHK
ncbi:MAG: hypothetical protein EOP85_14985 [Verrucomicrobiaceae bacterium]|nr:MAG: hypothetical protein EOP85_14985 [Verrucomicrobiaceae bacterium]